MLNLRGAVLRLCLRALLTGAGLGIPPARTGGRRGRSPAKEITSLLGSMSVGECQPTQTLHLDIQDPTGFRAYFFVKVGAKVKHFSFLPFGALAGSACSVLLILFHSFLAGTGWVVGQALAKPD